MSIPKPLVQLNQLFIIITVIAALAFWYWLLIIPFINGVMTLMTKKNPVIQAGKGLLKKEPDQYEQEDRDQQLFNQWIATVCLGVSLIFFIFGMTMAGMIFSGMVVVAAALALAGFCIGCQIRYKYMMWKSQRSH